METAEFHWGWRLCHNTWVDTLEPYKTAIQGLHHTLTGPAGWIVTYYNSL